MIRENELRGGKTIVHCIAGVSRSVSLCAAYLMTKVRSEKVLFGNSNMGATEAIKYIQKRRPCANPNPSFMHQLKKYEEQLKIPRNSTSISIENDLTEEEANVLESMKDIYFEKFTWFTWKRTLLYSILSDSLRCVCNTLIVKDDICK